MLNYQTAMNRKLARSPRPSPKKKNPSPIRACGVAGWRFRKAEKPGRMTDSGAGPFTPVSHVLFFALLFGVLSSSTPIPG